MVEQVVENTGFELLIATQEETPLPGAEELYFPRNDVDRDHL
ncbi:MAG TPA: hypothetical protein VLA49_17410 [Anaerolineales bacterium]|nr:hypothetical protein [Anaerolineales bacterium]